MAMATGTTATSTTSNGASTLKHRHGNGQQSSFADLPSNRRSSTFSSRSSRTDSTSDRRPFSARSSTEDLLSPRAMGEEEEEQHHETTTFWHSLPILFAIVPALGGIYSKDGSTFVTDLALLMLAGLYLNWCLVTPWTWYHSAQSRIVENYIPEDALSEDQDQDQDQDSIPTSSSLPTDDTTPPPQPRTPTSHRAIRELRYHELFSLLLCFLGPLLGSYILHLIRFSLSRASDDLVSSLHLTLFVLCAEIRPLRHAMKLLRHRTLFLQRVIREDPATSSSSQSDSDSRPTLASLSASLSHLESSFADLSAKQAAAPTPNPSSITSQIAESETTRRIHSAQTHLQTQIDALTRAVRRYEKRATAQTMQTEARLQDLEGRMRDTLTLAAAAATNSRGSGRQGRGVLAGLVRRMGEVIIFPIRTARAVLAYSLGLVDWALTEVMVLAGLKSRRPGGRQSSGFSNGSARVKGKERVEGYAR